MGDKGLFFYTLKTKAVGTGPSIAHPNNILPKPGTLWR